MGLDWQCNIGFFGIILFDAKLIIIKKRKILREVLTEDLFWKNEMSSSLFIESKWTNSNEKSANKICCKRIRHLTKFVLVIVV